ncbi:MAG TPA: hypothetical protein VJ965_03095 [Anaerolineales bacterium]|nr:hypothetical protein [Anaerolineales bacterium]
MDTFDNAYPEFERNVPDEPISEKKGQFNLSPGVKKVFWQGRVMPAFWSVGAFLSILLNIILIVTVAILLNQLFSIKQLVTDDLIGGLYYNFLLMDQATITTSVQVEDTIPVQFDMPLKQTTNVILTEDTTIEDATVSLTTGGLNIVEAPTDIVLPAGTVLPVKLDLVVPVDTRIPVTLNVPVDIPLNETELHEPFTGLQDVVSPYYWLLIGQPSNWSEAKCTYLGWGCP